MAGDEAEAEDEDADEGADEGDVLLAVLLAVMRDRSHCSWSRLKEHTAETCRTVEMYTRITYRREEGREGGRDQGQRAGWW